MNVSVADVMLVIPFAAIDLVSSSELVKDINDLSDLLDLVTVSAVSDHHRYKRRTCSVRGI